MIPQAHVAEAAAAVRRAWTGVPLCGVILGTGLSSLADEMRVAAELPCAEIPHLAPPTAPTHRGALVCGTLDEVPVIVMAGRCHGYEGHRATQVAFSIRVLAELGCRTLVLSNACGGLNPNYRAGDLMLVEDHLNFTFDNPLVGRHDQHSLGYPDMSCPYDRELIAAAAAAARRENIVAHQGVYVGVLGPNYETRAEYRMFRHFADGVGMSTVHEVIAARQLGLRVAAISVVTNECRPDILEHATSGQVECVATTSAPKVATILRAILAKTG